MAVAYWEIPELGDEAPGSSPTLKNPETVQKIWPPFMAGQELGLTVYGRENSWGSTRTLFKATGVLKFVGPMNFTVHLASLSKLDLTQAAELLSRCQSKYGPLACQDLEP